MFFRPLFGPTDCIFSHDTDCSFTAIGAGYKLSKKLLFDLGFVWPHLLIINRILYLHIFYLCFGFRMILLIQCFKAFNNALGWKDPDSREREGRNKVGRAQPQLHIKGQAENKKQNYYEKH